MERTKTKKTFTKEERSAMRDRARELKNDAHGERDMAESIAKMQEPDRTMAKRIHALIKASAPSLSPKTWYGMPAWAKDGNVVCFFQSRQKFKTRYATFGFSDKAQLDEGTMWPNGFAVKELAAADEARLVALVKQAVGT